MARRRWRLYGLLGSAFAMGVTLGCLEDDDFVAEYATEVCRMVRDCGRELYLPVDPSEPAAQRVLLPATGECEMMIEAHYSTCRSDCQFHRGKARRCLRRIRENVCDTENPDPSDENPDDDIALVCGQVFEECAGGPDQDEQCGRPSCSVGASSQAGASVLWMLGLLGLGARGRRRYELGGCRPYQRRRWSARE